MITLIKDCERCMWHSIPYQYYTKLIIQSLISCMVKWMNAFPTKVLISNTMIPSMIVKGKTNYAFNQEMIVFGSYYLVYIGTRNYTNRRSISSIVQKGIKLSWEEFFHEIIYCEEITSRLLDIVNYWQKYHRTSKSVVFVWERPTS